MKQGSPMDLQSAEMPLKSAEHALPEGRRVGSIPRTNAVALQYDFSKNCRELLARGVVLSGWYTIYPWDCHAGAVLCKMDMDKGSWLVSATGAEVRGCPGPCGHAASCPCTSQQQKEIQNILLDLAGWLFDCENLPICLLPRQVFQRVDGSVDFFDWNSYKKGFGSQLTKFWLRNDNIHILTSEGKETANGDMEMAVSPAPCLQAEPLREKVDVAAILADLVGMEGKSHSCNNELRIDRRDSDNKHHFTQYMSFKILGENENYKLILGNFSGGNTGKEDPRDKLEFPARQGECTGPFMGGTARDAQSTGDSLVKHKNMPFLTKGNNAYSNNCAVTYKGAWWYHQCHNSNLNGFYHHGAHYSFADGVNWQTGKGHKYSYQLSEMKFRPA
ncbi:LOW QUALITY PROTEIN: ficolin-2-like [Spheniscus humboldti]